MKLLGDLKLLSFVRISRLILNAPVITMNNNRKVFQVFKIILKETTKRATKTVSVTVYRHIF